MAKKNKNKNLILGIVFLLVFSGGFISGCTYNDYNEDSNVGTINNYFDDDDDEYWKCDTGYDSSDYLIFEYQSCSVMDNEYWCDWASDCEHLCEKLCMEEDPENFGDQEVYHCRCFEVMV